MSEEHLALPQRRFPEVMDHHQNIGTGTCEMGNRGFFYQFKGLVLALRIVCFEGSCSSKNIDRWQIC